MRLHQGLCRGSRLKRGRVCERSDSSRGEPTTEGEEVVKEREKKIPKFYKLLTDPEFTLRVADVQADGMANRPSYPVCV